jgi:hypothetical protein
MVNLISRARLRGPLHELRGVRNVVWEKPQDIFPMLRTNSSSASTLRADATPFVPKGFDTVAESTDLQNDGEGIALALEVGNGDSERAPVAEQTESISVGKTHEFTAEEIDAARRIADVYLRVSRRRTQKGRSGVHATREAFFASCSKVARTMEWPHIYYKLIFLGPLAHALLSADAVQRWTYASKQKAKKQVKDLQHQDIEEARARQTKS